MAAKKKRVLKRKVSHPKFNSKKLKFKKQHAKKAMASAKKIAKKAAHKAKFRGKLILGIDVGASFIKAGIVEIGAKNARIVRHAKKKTEADMGKDIVIQNIFSVIDELLANDMKGKVKAIGIGFPAPVDDKGNVHEVTNIKGFTNINIKHEVEKRFKIKTCADNDANCFALGEFTYGAAMGKQSAICITLGTGIGAGIIIHGKLYRGNSFAAGELGNAPYKDRTVEKFVNASALSFMSLMATEDLGKKADAGDDFAKYVLNEYGKELGNIIAIVINFIDPEIIVLGGGLSHLFRHFEKPMKDNIKGKVFAKSFENTKIVQAKLSEPGVIGAALLAK